MAAVSAQTPFQSASLYVGDLHNESTEGLLFEIFNRVGPVASIRVCRDAVTRRSLGYSYVNFHAVEDAERALDTMNFTEIKGRPCRIMWSQRDPSLRKSGVGNVFIKNLPPSIDNKGLFDTFSVSGNILSCKVATDDAGASKGYGYVHYETAEAAEECISKFNGLSIDDHDITVGLFVRRGERADQTGWTNLYVKNFPENWDDEKVKATFATFGAVASVLIKRDPEGKSLKFGFVNFAEHDAAEKALNDLNNKTMDDDTNPGTTFELYVNRAQKKTERQREITSRIAALNQERASKYQGMNLYVKNLDESITDENFRETFAKYGTITSARIMRDDNTTSKGFGFICYSSPEEATAAVTEMNGKILRSKPIVVTLHQRKELRRAHLAATYAPRNMRFPPNGPGGMPMPYGMGMYVPQQGGPGFARFPGAAGGPGFPPGSNPRGNPRGVPPFNAGRGVGGPAGYNMAPYGMYAGMPPVQGMNGQMPQQGLRRPGGPNGQQPMQDPRVMNNAPQQGLRRPGGMPTGRGVPPGPGGPMGGPGRGMGGPYQQQGQGGMRANTNQNGIKFNNQVRNPMGMMPPHMSQPAMPTSQVPGGMNELDDQALAAADPAMQKNMIGERLYPLIYVQQPQLAGKITGMLLEMDNAELLNLIESPDALVSKIDEALAVLKTHQTDAAGGNSADVDRQ